MRPGSSYSSNSGVPQMLSDERCATIERMIAGTFSVLASTDWQFPECTDMSVLSECLNDNACSTKGKAQNVKATRIYAVRANFNKMLDVARETYKENIEDIYQCAWRNKHKFGRRS